MASGTATLLRPRDGLVPSRHQLLIALAGAAIFFSGLGSSRLWDEDEAEYSRCAREMMARGDWVVPTFNGAAWLEKPVLVYWLMIGSFRLFGPTEFAARFPSAVFAIGTALLTFRLGRRLFRPQVGLWAALILLSTLMFVLIARAATLDSTLIFFTTLSLWAYVRAMPKRFWREPRWTTVARSASEENSRKEEHSLLALRASVALPEAQDNRLSRFRAVLPQSWWSFVAMYVPMGVAVMVKGPLGVLLPIASLGMFVWISGSREPTKEVESQLVDSQLDVADDRRIRLIRWSKAIWRRARAMAPDFPAATWSMRPLTLAAIVLAIAAPWYVLAGIRTHGEFWNVFLWQHNVQYILHSQQGHAGSGLYYYPLALIIGFFPWTLALALGGRDAVRAIRRGEAGSRGFALALTWSAVWFIVMSLVGTKLPHYIVPAYPMMALMAGNWISNWIATSHAAANQTDAIECILPLQSAERWIRVSLAALALLGIVMAIGLPLVVQHWAPGEPGFAWLGSVLAIGGATAFVLQMRRHRAASVGALFVTAGAFFIGLFGLAGPQFSTRQTSIQMTDAVERLGTPDTPVGIYRAYLPGLIFYSNRQRPIMRVRTRADAEQLAAAAADFLLITDIQGLAELRSCLPADAVVLEQQTRFLKGTEMVVVGRQAAAAATALPSEKPPAAVSTSRRAINR
jgi:4-amino-4-deoxy-L-arabinose transferase-like glycosyltransferase